MNPGSLFGALPIQPIYLKIRPNWQCYLADSSKKAPRILIFSIAMGADHSFYVKTLETHARAFLPALNISAVCSVLIFYAISLNLDSHAVTDTTKASLLQSGI